MKTEEILDYLNANVNNKETNKKVFETLDRMSDEERLKTILTIVDGLISLSFNGDGLPTTEFADRYRPYLSAIQVVNSSNKRYNTNEELLSDALNNLKI